MKAALVLLCCGLVAGFQWVGGHATNSTEDLQQQEEDQREARRLWEEAIAAKGGRERLCGVHNLVVFHGGGKRNISLYVFPNKSWQWSDDRPTPLGLSVEMHNLDRRLAYFVYSEDLEPPINKGWGSNLARGVPELRDAQLYYLLETAWVKPVPLRVATDRRGYQQTDIVETLVNGSRVDFHLDQNSHLPLEVAFPSRDGVGTSYGRGTYYVTFSDYRDVSGIQMPHRVGFLIKNGLPTTFEINVDCDAQIFERPPNIADGPDAWRRSGQAVKKANESARTREKKH